MHHFNGFVRIMILAVFLAGGFIFVQCDDSGADDPDGFTVGGSATGLSGTAVLQLKTNEVAEPVYMVIEQDGKFLFPGMIEMDSDYLVTIQTQPSTITCTASNNSGIATKNVTDINIVCSSKTYTIGGTVDGLTGTVVLQNNSTEELSISSTGQFTFAGPVTHGSGYAVTVMTQPEGQVCTVNNGDGTAEGNVSSVNVICSTKSYTIGGTISGLSAPIVLQNNSGDYLYLAADGDFTFDTPVAHGSTYSVAVKMRPEYQSCGVTSGSGTAEADVDTVSVTCGKRYAVLYSAGAFSGSVTGISGTSRARVDKYCGTFNDFKPSGFSHYRGFISISDTDEIRDMPDNYGVPTDVRIVGPGESKIADNWADLLDGSIDGAFYKKVTNSYYWWSGSDQYGALNTSSGNCSGFTSSSSSVTGAKGNTNKYYGEWINYTGTGGSYEQTDGSCDEKLDLICIAYDEDETSIGASIMSAGGKTLAAFIIVVAGIIIALGTIIGITVYRRNKGAA